MKKNTILLFASILIASLAINCGKKEEKASEADQQATASVNGKEIFTNNCVSCHGENGEGNGPAAAALNPKPRNFKAPTGEWKNGKDVAGITKTLKEGIAPGMASYSYLKEEEIAALANYILEIGK